MVIDCERCEVRGLACGDCVVGVLLGMPGVPPGGCRTGSDGGACRRRPSGASAVQLDAPEQRALAVLADQGLVPRLRLVSTPLRRVTEAVTMGRTSVTWGEITPFCAGLSRAVVHSAGAPGCRAPPAGGPPVRPRLAPLRNLRETSRTAVVRHGRRPPEATSVTRSAARAGVGRRRHGGRSRVSVVPPRRFRSSRPHPVSSRPPPAAPALGGLPPRCSWPSSTLICSVLGAGPAAAQPAIPVPRPGRRSGAGAACRWSPRRPTRSRRHRPAPADGDAAPPPNPPAADPSPGPGADGRRGCRRAAAAGAARGRGAHRAVARRAGRRHRAACRAGHPARRDRPGPGRGRRRPRRRGAVPRAGRHRRAVDVRERPARRVQRAAGQRDAAGLPRPDVGAGDDRRGPRRRRWTS